MHLCILLVKDKWRINKYQIKWLLINNIIESVTKLNYAKTYKMNEDWKIEDIPKKVFLLRINSGNLDEIMKLLDKSIGKNEYSITYFWKDFN